MESDKEVLNKIVSKRVEKIQSEALDSIRHIRESSETQLNRIVPDLLKQIENFSVFKLLDVLDVLRDGGIVQTGECESLCDDNHWRLVIGDLDPFPYESYQNRLAKGRYRITLIMEKLPEKAED